MNFAEILGQDDAKRLLKNAIKAANTSHAYIFSGEKGSGKTMLAEAFAAMLLCDDRHEDDSCGQCHSCKQALTRNNPDIIYVTREEDKKILGVEQIRTQVNNDIVLKPYGGKYKIYIIPEAEKMNQQAQNALLKTIEEPPSYAIIILLTSNHNSLLQTILSRCVTIQMKPVDTNLIKQQLQNKFQIVDYQSEMVASFAQGNMGKAIELASDESFNQMRRDVTSLVKKASTMDEYGVSESVKAISEYKLTMDQILDLITLWYRDVLLYKATLDESHIIFREDIYDIKEQALNCSYVGLNQIFTAVDEARDRLKANVNFELTVMLLILALKENTK